MAIKIRKAEPIGQLKMAQSSQPVIRMATNVSKPVVRIAQPRNDVITGIETYQRPQQQAAQQVPYWRTKQGMQSNPLQYFANTAGEFGKGMWNTGGAAAKMLAQGTISAPERLLRSTAGLAFNPDQQDLLRSDLVAGIPGTEELAKVLYGGPIETYQDLLTDDKTGKMSPWAIPALPLMAGGDALGMTGTGMIGKAGQKAIIAAGSKNSVKDKAVEFLINQQLVGNKRIPITKTGGGDVPIPVRVNTKIPVRSEAPNDVLDQRLSTEVDVLHKRYTKAMAEAGDDPNQRAVVEAEYGPKFEALIPLRESGKIPQRIPVTDAPKKPRVSLKDKTGKSMDTTTVNISDPKKSMVDEYIPAARDDGKSPGLVSRFFRSVGGVLDKNGTGGKMIHQGVENIRNYAEKSTSKAIVDLKRAGFDDIDDEGMVRVWDAVEKGSAEGLDQTERRVAAALVKTMYRVHQGALKAGMKIGNKGATYLPHWFKDSDKNGVALIKKEFSSKDSNLEKVRVDDAEGYEKTKESIVRYIQNANERVGHSKNFGQNDELLQKMFDVAKREGYDVEQVAKYAKTALGRNDYETTGHKLSGMARQYEAITSLQRSAIANIGQIVNTLTVSGVRNSMKAMVKMMGDSKTRDWAERSGVYGDHVLGRLQKQYAGIGGDYTTGNKAVATFKKHWLVPGMQAVEKFNRAHGVIAGKMYAEDLAKKAATGNKSATRRLKDMIPNYKPGMELTDEQLTDAGRNLVQRTQFKTDPVDLPNWADNSVGKLIFQFRSFGYKQTQFMAREVIGEALQGNFAPMARFTAIGVPAGYGIARMKEEGTEFATSVLQGGDWTSDDEDDKKDAEQPLWASALEGFSQIGGGGLPLSEGTNIARSVEYANPDDKLRDAAVATTGPLLTDVARALDAGSKAMQGEYKDGAVFIAQQIPIVGPIASKYTQSFFKGETDVTKMNAEELDNYKKQTFAKYMDGLSDKDKDLMDAVNDSDYARLGMKGGKFTQDEIDNMQATYNRELFKAGLPIKYVKGITDEEFDTLPDEMKGMVMEASMVGTKKFAESEKLDPTADAVMKKAMESAWPEVGELKFNNQMALDYVQAQRDYVKNEGDEGKQFDVVKGYWKKAITQQYSKEIRNLYGNSLADIGRLYEGITVSGVKYEITRQDMDAAVALDDRLLVAGLIDQPKFSAKNREKYGYGAAPTSKVEGAGYAGPKTSSYSGGYSRSGGSGGSSPNLSNPYAHVVKRGSKSKLSGKASSSGGKASVKLAGSLNTGSTAKPKVSIKKNKV